MPTSRVSVTRRAGQLLTGLGALIVLVVVLGGAPIALLAFAGNPLPDHVPTFAEIGTTLTSRDDGQLFLRALALLGWAGWATFALSVLVELPARMLGRPAIRLPGMSRQQRAAAALVGSVAVILAASPAATAATTLAGPNAHSVPIATAMGVPGQTAVAAPVAAPAGPVPGAAGPAPHWLAAPPEQGTARSEPVYRVEKGDYLGHIARRYLGDFNEYPELASLNKLRDPDRIRPGQLLRMPEDAADRGHRPHATGLVNIPPPPGGYDQAEQPEPEPPAPVVPPRVGPPSDGDETSFAGGAARPGDQGGMNRPLAVAAVIAAASIIGAQIGAVLGLRRQSIARIDPLEAGRHRNRPRRPHT
jgi:hypothetical protein